MDEILTYLGSSMRRMDLRIDRVAVALRQQKSANAFGFMVLSMSTLYLMQRVAKLERDHTIRQGD